MSAPVKRVNLALQGGGSHGAYSWGALDALLEDERIEIVGVSGASAGAMNAVVFAAGLGEGRVGARRKLGEFWLAVSQEGALPAVERPLFDAWMRAWKATFTPQGWVDAVSQVMSPYAFNPFNFDPLRGCLTGVVDFEALRGAAGPKLFIAATNVWTGQGEIFRREVLTADHVLASACLPRMFQAVEIAGAPYWDGGYSGNPPLTPLVEASASGDVIIVQINPIRRDKIPQSPLEINNRVNEITFNASLLAELDYLRAVAKITETGGTADAHRLHRIGGDGRLERFPGDTKFDASWDFLQQLRDLGRASAKDWLQANFDAIGVRSTLDVSATLHRTEEG